MVDDPVAFATAWCAAWNAHDLDRVLEHFHEDVVFTSPVATAVLPGSDGVLHGREALRRYWARGLELIPDLHFTVLAVFAGTSTVVIQYRNQRGHAVSEVLHFEGTRVREGHGTYLVDGGHDAGNPAGLTTAAPTGRGSAARAARATDAATPAPGIASTDPPS